MVQVYSLGRPLGHFTMNLLGNEDLVYKYFSEGQPSTGAKIVTNTILVVPFL